ncbi:uncharacterized protein PGTG_17886 [Puccinia graminis f. sp. tritici CRL 75-36-700-3]|uniref:Uncharacterized protein n=1 Tax=Puccinia graminis f. sp. tritici (strain CRL 75-36-700-3 / race SCCL) TaxID=418459 RepID=E3L6I1_PUCGT|nr:uncharacterized protein PGTG_17886 [Puccinia graminis f. sp. tritici CRL 75-36-700-3]EFP92156.2 hypothetical protein PGTG_17886 [Puccinia graminis f. sp. tritici CRL 75-36-700-3]
MQSNSNQDMISMYLRSSHHSQGGSHNENTPDSPQATVSQPSPHSNSQSSPAPVTPSEEFDSPLPCFSRLPSPAPIEVYPFKCYVSYEFYLEKRDRGQKLKWKLAKSPASNKLCIEINPNHIGLDEFKKAVGSACSIALAGVDITIAKAGKKGVPKIRWDAFIPNDRSCPKSRAIHLENPTDYCRWVETISKKKKTTREGAIHLVQDNPKKKEANAIDQNLVDKLNHRLQAASQNEGTSTEARTDSNNDPNPDESDNEGSVIEDQELYMSKIYAKYGLNHKFDRIHPTFPHPTNHSKYILLSAGNVRIWADALVGKKRGVSLESPPSDLNYLVAKKREAAPEAGVPSGTAEMMTTAVGILLDRAVGERNQNRAEDGQLGIPLAENIEQYLLFIGCNHPEVDVVADLLRTNGFVSYLTFGSPNLDNAPLIQMGLSLGLVLRLRDNVHNFSLHLRAQEE